MIFTRCQKCIACGLLSPHATLDVSELMVDNIHWISQKLSKHTQFYASELLY